MEAIGLVLSCFTFVEQAAHTIASLRSLPGIYRSNRTQLDTIQSLTDSLIEQRTTLQHRFNAIAPSLTSLQLTCLEFHVRGLDNDLAKTAASLKSLNKAISHRTSALRRAKNIKPELRDLDTFLRDVQRLCLALHANLSTFETCDQSTAAELDASFRLYLLILILFTMGLIAISILGIYD
eukprot:GFKZ01003432.1.p1 GENE.GFKZ01003432.1~~GFKZ01003432.1.p1  ORF type:complete len:180 (-),score=9.18 GFKZ01003432.1:889-1428(-)